MAAAAVLHLLRTVSAMATQGVTRLPTRAAVEPLFTSLALIHIRVIALRGGAGTAGMGSSLQSTTTYYAYGGAGGAGLDGAGGRGGSRTLTRTQLWPVPRLETGKGLPFGRQT